MAQEPLGFRWPWFSHGFSRTESGILTSRRSTRRLPPWLQRSGNAPLPLAAGEPAVQAIASVDGLQSRPFSAQPRWTGELLRTL
jgi:hypothetical protein